LQKKNCKIIFSFDSVWEATPVLEKFFVIFSTFFAAFILLLIVEPIKPIDVSRKINDIKEQLSNFSKNL